MKILIPVDGSASAQRAVDHVIHFVSSFKDMPQLLLLNVQWNVAKGNVKLFIDHQTIHDYYHDQGIAALRTARAALDDAGMTYQYHISIGTPGEAIAQYGREQCADLIVMGRQGQGGLKSLLLGSVVKSVLQIADCPVLLVK
jgi:nucleotide-binding universal stress UspA family protein